MAIIPGFLYDVFISYAHIDNRSSAMQPKGWIDEFHNELSLLLIQHFGIEPRIWYDNTKLDNSTIFDSSIKKGVLNSAIIICINSPSYNNSTYCLQELEFFYTKAKANLVIGDRSRIIHVLLNNIPHKTWPKQLAGTTGFRFFNSKGADHLGDRFKVKSSRFEKEIHGLRDSIANLTKDICLRQNSDNPIVDELKIETVEKAIAAQKVDVGIYEQPVNTSGEVITKDQIIPQIKAALATPKQQEVLLPMNQDRSSKDIAAPEITTKKQQLIHPGLTAGPVNEKKYWGGDMGHDKDETEPVDVTGNKQSDILISKPDVNLSKPIPGNEHAGQPFQVLKIAVLLVGVLLFAGFIMWRSKVANSSKNVVNKKDTTADVNYVIPDNEKIRQVLLYLNKMNDSTENKQKMVLNNAVSTYFNPQFIVNLKYDKLTAHAVPIPGPEYLSGLYTNNQLANIIVTRLVSTNHKIDSMDVVEVHKKPLDIKNK